MKCLKTFAVLAVLYMRSAVAASTCLPLITDCSICAISPGIISSDGFDDVCNLVDCCNGGSTLSVKIPSGSTIACKDVDCKSVCNLSLARNGGNDANEACINTCTPPSFDWAPLVQRACNDYNQASGIAPQTLGYFGQVRNIVCSAAKSLDPCCGDMRLTYGACDTLWAGQFVEFVFNRFLGPNAESFNTVVQALNEIAAIASAAVFPFQPSLTPIFGPKDAGAILAGIEHFNNDLEPAFGDYMKMVARCDAVTCNEVLLRQQISAVRSEHQSLFNCAVLPGFLVEGKAGQISPIAVGIAQSLVPWAAARARDTLITNAISEFYTPNCGVLTPPPATRSLMGRWLFNNETTPTISQINSMAAFLNLTAPQSSPLAYDPGAWIPTVQAPASVSTLPSAHLQILPNSSAVMIEANVLDSTASVHVSADRSAFASEAVVAVCINSVSPNPFSNGSTLTTAVSIPNTTLSVVGIVSLIFPATAPIGNNSYLFDTTGVNTTFAQYLNQSSFFNEGYNVLFSAFDLTITYDQLPAGVHASDLVLVDLVSMKVVGGSKVDKSKKAVIVGGLTGNPGVWGGGGIYAVGFGGTVSSTGASTMSSTESGTISSTTSGTASGTASVTASNTSSIAPSHTVFAGSANGLSKSHSLKLIWVYGLIVLGPLL